MQWRYATRCAAALSMALALSGCGEKGETLCPVAGKVTLRGNPVSAGMIRFSSTQSPIDMLANLGPDGTYEITRAQGPGLPEGTYRVAVLPSMGNRPIGEFGVKRPPVQSADIPEKYRSITSSGLTFVVKPGNNTFDVEMQRP